MILNRHSLMIKYRRLCITNSYVTYSLYSHFAVRPSAVLSGVYHSGGSTGSHLQKPLSFCLLTVRSLLTFFKRYFVEWPSVWSDCFLMISFSSCIFPSGHHRSGGGSSEPHEAIFPVAVTFVSLVYTSFTLRRLSFSLQ